MVPSAIKAIISTKFSGVRAVVGDYPALRDQWHALQDEATREEALEWLAELGIEPAEKS